MSTNHLPGEPGRVNLPRRTELEVTLATVLSSTTKALSPGLGTAPVKANSHSPWLSTSMKRTAPKALKVSPRVPSAPEVLSKDFQATPWARSPAVLAPGTAKPLASVQVMALR